MGLDSTRREAAPAKLLFDPSAEWMRVARPQEPDLAVDGLRRFAVVERVLKLLGKRKN